MYTAAFRTGITRPFRESALNYRGKTDFKARFKETEVTQWNSGRKIDEEVQINKREPQLGKPRERRGRKYWSRVSRQGSRWICS